MEERGSLVWRHRRALGNLLYVLAAALDIRMTLAGVSGDTSLEGNPLMRAAMETVGVPAGLLLEKAAVWGLCWLIAVHGEPEIARKAPWIFKIPQTPWTRRYLQTRDARWIAFIPLYGVAASQFLAALSWLAVSWQA